MTIKEIRTYGINETMCEIIKYKNLKTFPLLTTERLTLRQFAECDVHELFLLRSDSLINKYLNRRPAETIEDGFKFIEMIKNSFSYWAITIKGHDKLVGTICLFNISEELKRCEIGYELLIEYHGRGFMWEASNKIIDYSIQTLKLKSIEAYTHKNNYGSAKLLKKLKFISLDCLIDQNSSLILFRLNI